MKIESVVFMKIVLENTKLYLVYEDSSGEETASGRAIERIE